MTSLEPLGDWLAIAPLRTRATVFVLIEPDTATQAQAHGIQEKRDMLANDAWFLLVGWTGKWRTDVRSVGSGEWDDLSAALA